MNTRARFYTALLAAVMLLTTLMPVALSKSNLADGLYTIGVVSSSDMFKIAKCVLTVDGGQMTAAITLSGTGYGYLYAGTGEEATGVPESEWIPFEEGFEGEYIYTMPISELDTEIPVAAYSNKKQTWYDRTLRFTSETIAPYTSVAPDGQYQILAQSDAEWLAGAYCALSSQGGVMTATIPIADAGVTAFDLGAGEIALTGSTVTLPVESLDAKIPFRACVNGTWEEFWLELASTDAEIRNVSAPDGVYTIDVESDSGLFRVESCKVAVENGVMRAELTVQNANYDLLYAGTAADALNAADQWIPAVTSEDGARTFTMDVPTLDNPVMIATHSPSKDMWYDRTLTFLSASMVSAQTANVIALTDGEYVPDGFTYSGGSGKVTISCDKVVVADGIATATVVFSSAKYTQIAVNGVTYAATSDGETATFEIPVTLNADMEIIGTTTAMSKTTEIAYTIRVDVTAKEAPAATPAFADGEYVPDEFTYSDGSGKVTISCDRVVVEDGIATATIVFSSAKYTQVAVNGVTYAATSDGETATFEIPVTLNADMEIVGTTTAMSKTTEIAYTIRISLNAAVEKIAAGDAPEIAGLTYDSTMELLYANCFQVYRYAGDYSLIDVQDGARYLVVPERAEVPASLSEDIVVLKQPIDNIYLAATSAMALFDAMDALDSIRLTGTAVSGWYIENAVAAMEKGDILFAGKYSEPDFEMLLLEKCGLAIESTMILHNPNVKEMIELLDIPVFIDRSSYETEPLGRTEWIKLYGVLVGKEDEAQSFFEEQASVLENPEGFESTGKTVAFFYISTDGSVVIRNSFDYVTKMIELAGGVNAFVGVIGEDETRSSVSISMEDFYAAAVDADYLVYNATIDDPVSSVDELLVKGGGTLADFKAVREGNVWCTGKYLYQATDVIGNLIGDFHGMLTGAEDGMTFLYKVN